MKKIVKQINQTYKLLCIELGMRNNGYVEIKNNVNREEGVTKNAYTLLMKLKIIRRNNQWLLFFKIGQTATYPIGGSLIQLNTHHIAFA